MFGDKFHGTYDPSKVIVTLDDVVLSGFSDNEFIKIKYDEDRFQKVKGIDGEVGRIRNMSFSGTVEITLMSSSESNKWLSGFHNLARLGKTKPFSISILDLSGSSVMRSSKSWIKTASEVTFGKEIVDNVWTIDCADMKIVHGHAKNNSIASLLSSLF